VVYKGLLPDDSLQPFPSSKASDLNPYELFRQEQEEDYQKNVFRQSNKRVKHEKEEFNRKCNLVLRLGLELGFRVAVSVRFSVNI
jgi:hypothetical protein